LSSLTVMLVWIYLKGHFVISLKCSEIA
jgi:hypothetical protein